MSAFISLVLMTALQLFSGFGLLALFRIRMQKAVHLSLSVLLGVALFSFIPFLLELFYIPLTSINIGLGLVFSALLCNARTLKEWPLISGHWKENKTSIKLYEWPALLVIAAIVAISVWRCFYLPPTPRDITSGAEAIAAIAVKEKTMINSLFTVNLESTNNPFKPPFITSLQIIYKYAGFPFGQLWLSAIFISFTVFLYRVLCNSLHPVLAGFFLVFFLAIPEMYGYTFMVLFDYSNAVYYFLSFYFLRKYIEEHSPGNFWMAALLMAIATYIRSETLVLAALSLPLIYWYLQRLTNDYKRSVLLTLSFLAIPALAYFLSVSLYINHYLPVRYDVGNLVNPNLFDISHLVQRFLDMNSRLLWSHQGTEYYGYYVTFFFLLLLNEFILIDRQREEARFWLLAAALMYIGYPILGHLLPLLDIDHSTKRGLFKLFPLILLYFAHNGLLLLLTQKISAWEKS